MPYLRYSDIVNQKLPLTTLKKKLRQFKLSNVMFTLSRVNVLLGRQRMLREGREEMKDLQYRLIANYIDDQLLEDKLKPQFGHLKVDEHPVFLRQQILGLLRQCALVCRESATVLTDGKTPGGYEFGRCCLIMNDHLLSQKEARAIEEGTNSKRRKHLGLQLAPLLELYNPPEVDQAVVRAESIFSEVLRSPEMQAIIGRELRGFDIEKAFLNATGLTIDKYKEFILAIISWLYGHSRENLVDKPNLLMFRRSQFISTSVIDHEEFDRYLALDSISLSEAKARFSGTSAKLLAHFDYVLFRSRPLLELDDERFICADACFAVEKLSSGIYWTIIDSLKGNDKQTAFDAFGYLFELYVNRILRQISPLDGPLIQSPKYTTGESSFDGIICGRNHLIVMEYKASFMKTEAKYGGKVRAFEEELDKKFGVDKIKGTQKGVAQLANHIEWLFHEQIPKRGHIRELDQILQNSYSRVEKITPVLIVQEPILRFPMIEEMLSKRFVRLLKQKKVSKSIHVAPLAVIDIDTLEKMKPPLVGGDFTIEQCLNARAARDPGYNQNFHDFLVGNFPTYGKRDDAELNSKFAAIMAKAKRNFFGESHMLKVYFDKNVLSHLISSQRGVPETNGVTVDDLKAVLEAVSAGKIINLLSVMHIQEALYALKASSPEIAQEELGLIRSLMDTNQIIKYPMDLLKDDIISYSRGESPSSPLIQNNHDLNVLFSPDGDVEERKKALADTDTQNAEFLTKTSAANDNDRVVVLEKFGGTQPVFQEFYDRKILESIEGIVKKAEEETGEDGLLDACHRRGLDGMLQVKSVAMAAGIKLSYQYARIFGEITEKGRDRKGDASDLRHALLASTADIFVTHDEDLAFYIRRIPNTGIEVIEHVHELIETYLSSDGL